MLKSEQCQKDTVHFLKNSFPIMFVFWEKNCKANMILFISTCTFP